MRLSSLSLVFVAVSLLCDGAAAHGQWDLENRTPQPDDHIAYVRGEDGVPISGVEAKVDIQRTVGFFTGAGTPPIASRSLSNADGELRFSSETNWRDWIKAEIAARDADSGKLPDETREIEFNAYRWTVSGYWPSANSRIEFQATGRPALWRNGDPVELILPALQPTRIRTVSDGDGKPLANVRLWITQQHQAKKVHSQWDKIGAYAWTDASGLAFVWLPKGSYDVRWDTTLASTGATVRSDLKDMRTAEFGELKRPLPPRNAMADQKRVTAFNRGAFWLNESQMSLVVSDAEPDVYELAIEAPLVIVP